MGQQLQLGDIAVDVVFKDIKNIHLSVYPPSGHVRISAPARMNLDTIRVFAVSRLPWIKEQQKQLRAQEREAPRDFVDRESHYLWGQRYLLKVVDNAHASVELRHRSLVLHLPQDTDESRRQALIDGCYRAQLKDAIPPLIETWSPRLGVQVDRFFIQRMKTRWGSCNPSSRNIRLNSELAKKPRSCLEYIVLHEMLHLIEPTHNDRFQALMSKFMPHWPQLRNELNRLPVRHEEWKY